MSCLAEALEQFSTLTADYPCGDTPGLCAPARIPAQCSRTGKRLRRWPEALNSLRGLPYPRMATTPA
jgi:hypothetical protein